MPHRGVQVWELGMVIGAVDQRGEGGGKKEHPHRDSPPLLLLLLLLQM